jgi:hypothetical protein
MPSCLFADLRGTHLVLRSSDPSERFSRQMDGRGDDGRTYGIWREIPLNPTVLQLQPTIIRIENLI